MKKYSAILILLLSEILFIRMWVLCKELKDFFYFSVQNVQLIIIDYIHNDSGVPLAVVRILHNKATVGVVEFVRHYLYFWDIRFLIPLLSPLGFFSVLTGFWYLSRQKMRLSYKLAIFASLFSIPAIEMILKPQTPFIFRLILLSIPYVTLSLLGTWHFLKPKQPIRYGIFIALLLLSIWWFVVFQQELTNYCVNP